MIGRLTGHLVDEGEGGVLVIDVNGVGYEVTAPLGTRGRLAALAGDAEIGTSSKPVVLHVHTHVREDAFQLFGFASGTERDAFRIIIGISNVGPKLALALLGSITVSELATVVSRGETAKLTGIPGVGKKTAERLLLELKGKLDGVPAVLLAGAAAPAPARPAGQSELLMGALTRMGYRPAEAERAVASLAASKSIETASLGDLVREALALLSK